MLILPLRDAARAALAMLVTLVTAFFAIAAALDFDPSGGTQFEQSHAWVRDIGLTYHVGMDGLSLVLVTLTAVCVPCALGYGLWAGRSNLRVVRRADAAARVRRRPAVRRARPRALLRRLRDDARAARVPDRRLGRPEPRARDDPLHHLHARRVAADADRRDHARSAGRAVRPRRTSARATRAGCSSRSWRRSPSSRRSTRSTAGCRDAYREAPPEVAALLSGVVSKAGAYGMLRFALPLFPGPRTTCAAGSSRSRSSACCGAR